MLQISWAVITAINFSWVIYLWTRRRYDHPWLMWLFIIYAVDDGIFFVFGAPSFGGADLLNPLYFGRHIYIVVATFLWLIWYAAPLLFSVKIRYGRVSWAWYAATVIPMAIISMSEVFGLSVMTRRGLMHYVFEPVALVTAWVMVTKYTIAQIRDGEFPDFLAFVILVTTAPLGLKVLLLLNDQLLLMERSAAHAYHYAHMTAVIVVYHAMPKFKKWLFR